MFTIPSNLKIGGEYRVDTPGAVAELEYRVPPQSRMLVGLVFTGRDEGFLEDCQKAETALREAGIPAWPELDRIVTPDPDGEPVVWVSYVSSPAWWTVILVILGGIFLLPLLSIIPIWITDLLFPGFMDFIGSVVALLILGGMMMIVPRMLEPPKKEER